MGKDRPTLEELTERMGKSYDFDDVHDEEHPADWWFQESHEGHVLFVVFYTMACRWSLCTGCNLPSVGSSQPVDFRALVRQVDALFATPQIAERATRIAKVIVSNNGSVLDEETFSSTALMYLVAMINLRLPEVRAVSLETRIEYVDIPELEFLARAMGEREVPSEIELAIGFEAFDDDIRNDHFAKGLSLDRFEEFVQTIARSHLRLKCYYMQKPIVGLDDAAAVEDVCRGIDYLSMIADRYSVPINMHLNPTFVATGTPLEEAFAAGTYQPPRLVDVIRAVMHSRDKSLSIFVGLHDEGLAVPNGTCIRPGEEGLAEALSAFNRDQDYDALARVLAEAEATS